MSKIGKSDCYAYPGRNSDKNKGVPADICNNCGEYFLSETITEQVLSMAEEAVKKGIEVEIVRFVA